MYMLINIVIIVNTLISLQLGISRSSFVMIHLLFLSYFSTELSNGG